MDVSSRYEIAKDFNNGLLSALRQSFMDKTQSKHWASGYEAGCRMRAEKSKMLNEYLMSIGEEPMAVIRIV